MDEKKLDELTLNTCVLVQKALAFLYEKGVTAIWPVAMSGSVQLNKKAFFATFDKYAVQKYPTDGGYGLRAFTDYDGVRFFALLDNEEDINV